MPQVSFYLLDNPAEAARQLFACRLARKIRGMNLALHIRTGTTAATQAMDSLLWTFEDAAFLPHSTDPADHLTGLTLHADMPPVHPCAVLINLADELPDWIERFARIADLIGGSEAAKAAGRQRYREYQERGYPLEHHQIRA